MSLKPPGLENETKQRHCYIRAIRQALGARRLIANMVKAPNPSEQEALKEYIGY